MIHLKYVSVLRNYTYQNLKNNNNFLYNIGQQFQRLLQNMKGRSSLSKYTGGKKGVSTFFFCFERGVGDNNSTQTCTYRRNWEKLMLHYQWFAHRSSEPTTDLFIMSPVSNPLWAQSQCNCKSVESKKSDEKTAVGEGIPAGPGIVRSNHSMLSRHTSCRGRAEGGVSVKSVRSEVSIGEWGPSSSWFLSSSISLRVRGSASSRRASNWLLEARATILSGGAWVWLGVRATCICGGGRDSTVLMGRVVMFAVTGRSLSREGSCLDKGDISGEAHKTV